MAGAASAAALAGGLTATSALSLLPPGQDAASGAVAVIHAWIGEFASRTWKDLREDRRAHSREVVAKAIISALRDAVEDVRANYREMGLAMHEELILGSASRQLAIIEKDRKKREAFSEALDSAYRKRFPDPDPSAPVRLAIQAVQGDEGARQILSVPVQLSLEAALAADPLYQGVADPDRIARAVLSEFKLQLGERVMTILMTDEGVRQRFDIISSEIQARAQQEALSELATLGQEQKVVLDFLSMAEQSQHRILDVLSETYGAVMDVATDVRTLLDKADENLKAVREINSKSDGIQHRQDRELSMLQEILEMQIQILRQVSSAQVASKEAVH